MDQFNMGVGSNRISNIIMKLLLFKKDSEEAIGVNPYISCLGIGENIVQADRKYSRKPGLQKSQPVIFNSSYAP